MDDSRSYHSLTSIAQRLNADGSRAIAKRIKMRRMAEFELEKNSSPPKVKKGRKRKKKKKRTFLRFRTTKEKRDGVLSDIRRKIKRGSTDKANYATYDEAHHETDNSTIGTASEGEDEEEEEEI